MAEGLFVECFEGLEDPRMVNKCRHSLMDIVIIAVCATIANADGWDDIALFGQSKGAWLKQWLALPNGIPSADTFQRVFEHLDAAQFEVCFLEWVQRVFQLTEGQVVAIDGKVARGTCDGTGQGGLHLVSAWASVNGLTLGQVAVANKANEIVAIPQLLALLALQGCIVTVDAIGCQKAIVKTIRDRKADYIVTVKDNKPTLHTHLKTAFAAQDALGWATWDGAVARTEATGHGRHEIRQCWVLPDHHAHTLVRMERTTTRAAGVLTRETHYYISSEQADAATLLQHIRDHWTIENCCHWVLDVVFKEDASRTRDAAHNLAVLRKIALNLVCQHPAKGSLKGKRYQAALNEDFLTDVLKSSFYLMR